MAQTPREVIDSLMRKKPAERVGFMDRPWPQTLKKWVGQGYPTDDAGEPVDPADHFDFDLVRCGGWEPWDAKVGVSKTIEETDEWEIIRNGSGAALKTWKEKAGTPEHIDFLMTSREVWEAEYKPHVVGSARQRADEKSVREIAGALKEQRQKNKWTSYGTLFVRAGMRRSLGDICLYENMLLDPGWLHDYCRTYTELAKECYRILIEEAGRPDGIWLSEDLGYKNSLFCSPKTFGETIFPYYREMNKFFHEYDLPVVLHTCGLTEPAIDMIVDAGFDGLNPMEVKAGNDPLRIARKYGDKLALIGGLDARILESGDHDLIKKEVTELIEGMKSAGASYVFASDHSLATNIAYDDFRYAIDAYRKCMMY